MRKDKYLRMIGNYDGFRGARTVDAVLSQIPDDLKSRLTGRDLGLVMSAINGAYHTGRASTGAQVEDGAVWIDELQGLYELTDIAKIGRD